jgi:hypothetical protein
MTIAKKELEEWIKKASQFLLPCPSGIFSLTKCKVCESLSISRTNSNGNIFSLTKCKVCESLSFSRTNNNVKELQKPAAVQSS